MTIVDDFFPFSRKGFFILLSVLSVGSAEWDFGGGIKASTAAVADGLAQNFI